MQTHSRSSKEHFRKKEIRRRRRKLIFLLVFSLLAVAAIGYFGLYFLNNTIGKKIDVADTSTAVSEDDGEYAYLHKKDEDKDASLEVVQPEEVDATANLKAAGQWNLKLVNAWNKIDSTPKIELTELANGHAIDSRAYPDLQAMIDDCKAAGLSPLICSSFRTMEKQQSLFDKQIAKYTSQGYSEEDAEVEAAKLVAIPGTSEHQLGLAVDIVSLNDQNLNESQENTPEQKWLMENCYKYGFILRYPQSKSEYTGIDYEPWHYRYVGKEVAKEITEQGICLEEYLGATEN